MAGVLALALIAAVMGGAASPAIAEPIQDPTTLSTSPDRIWDVDVRSGLARHTGTYLTLVWDLQQIGDVMYVGGDFTTLVAPNGDRHAQPFLAAFDLETGEWIPSFNPDLNSVVYDLDVTSSGDLVVAGEIAGGVTVLNPATGAPVAGFDADLRHSWGPPAVFTVAVAGNSIYAGGRFVRAQGTTVDNLAKLNAATGTLDQAWMPSVEPVSYQGIMQERIRDIEVDTGRGRVYVGGLFGSVNGAAGSDSFAILSSADGSTVMSHPGIEPTPGPIIFLYEIELAGDKIRYGGKENFTITVDADTLERTEEVIYTNNGDHQVIHEGATTLWIGSHAWRQAYTAEPPHNPFDPPADAVDVNAFFGVDKATGEVVPITFHLKGSAGAWAIEEDPNGRVWVAGQFTQGGGRSLHGLARFSPVVGDDAAVASCTIARNGNQVDVAWANEAAPDGFVIRRSVNGGTVYRRGRADGNASSFVDSDRSGDLAYTVESRVGSGRLGEAVTCTEIVTEPEPPTGLRNTHVTKERVVLNWVANTPVEVARDGVVLATDGDGWYTDRTVASATTYEYRVRYVGAAAWSDPITVTTN